MNDEHTDRLWYALLAAGLLATFALCAYCFTHGALPGRHWAHHVVDRKEGEAVLHAVWVHTSPEHARRVVAGFLDYVGHVNATECLGVPAGHLYCQSLSWAEVDGNGRPVTDTGYFVVFFVRCGDTPPEGAKPPAEFGPLFEGCVVED
jgi:hypothetical protein